MDERSEDNSRLAKLRAANRLQRAFLQMGIAKQLEGVIDPHERSAIVHSVMGDLTWECNRCGGLFTEAEIINDNGVLCADCWRYETARRQHTTPARVAGNDVPWESLDGQYLRVQQLTPLAPVTGGDVARPAYGGVYGIVAVEVPRADLAPDQRAVSLWLQDKDEYRALYRACLLDAGVWDGTNEAIIVLSPRRAGLLGHTRRSLGIAIYPAGTWSGFLATVTRDDSPPFAWPEPLVVFRAPGQPSAFPAARQTIGI